MENYFGFFFQVSVTITLTSNSLTRIVMFTPYYVFLNKTDFAIESQESDLPDTNWVKIDPDCCAPFWPRSQGKVKSIHLRPYGTKAMTPDFNYDSTDSCLLRLNNQVRFFLGEEHNYKKI